MNIPYRRFQDSVRRHGNLIAIRSGAVDLTYTALERASREVGAGLMAAGVKPGDRVAIWGVNSAPWVLAALGIQAAGAVLVPLGTRLRGREAGAILRASDAKVIFCDARFGSFDFVEATLQQELPALERIIVMDDAANAGPKVMGLSGLRALGQAGLGETLDERIRGARPDDLADIIFTSGTTGLPKAVPMTNAQSIIACAAQQDELAAFTSSDVFAVTFPFAHNAGYRAGWQISLFHGVRVLPASVVEPGALLQLIMQERISYLPVVPTTIQGMLDHPDLEHTDLSSLRSIQTGGTTVPVALIKRLRARLAPMTLVQTGYGLTEAAGSVTMTREGDDDETVAQTAGRVLSMLELRILDKDRNVLPQGQTGEIALRGPQVLRSYLYNPESNRTAFTEDGFLLTGDAAWLDARGNLHMADRIKDMYIVGGFNCYPAEVENMMRAMPGIGQVAVVGIEDYRLGQVGHAFVVRAAESELDEAKVIAWCRQEMANYKVPRSVHFVDALPLNGTGKVDKAALRAQP